MKLKKRIAYRKTLQETSSFFDVSFLLEKLTISGDIARSITTIPDLGRNCLRFVGVPLIISSEIIFNFRSFLFSIQFDKKIKAQKFTLRR